MTPTCKSVKSQRAQAHDASTVECKDACSSDSAEIISPRIARPRVGQVYASRTAVICVGTLS